MKMQVLEIVYPQDFRNEHPVANGEIFETSEALLMKLSMQFRELWGNKLIEKLQFC